VGPQFSKSTIGTPHPSCCASAKFELEERNEEGKSVVAWTPRNLVSDGSRVDRVVAVRTSLYYYHYTTSTTVLKLYYKSTSTPVRAWHSFVGTKLGQDIVLGDFSLFPVNVL
jgi:hypothetical protein